MPSILMTFLYILLFILCLSMLIMIHELGHFTAAKIFKVYVQEYSIGFGPALIHKKRKNGETYFSLRVIPFGGYVSMYGEGVELEPGQEIDGSRSLEGIKRWKRAIIMAAGVTMNAILALQIFFIYNVSFTQTYCYYNLAAVTEGSLMDTEAHIENGSFMAFDSYISSNTNDYKGNLHLLDNTSVITLKDGTELPVYTYLNLDNFVNYKEENLKFTKFVTFYQSKIDGEITTVDYSKPISVDANFSTLKLTLSTIDVEHENQVVKHDPMTVGSDNGSTIQDIGYSLYLHVEKPKTFFKALGQSFVDFGESSIVIFKALGTLFTKSTWESMGGIVAIGFQTTSVLQNFGWGRFIYIWGVLSVNLAIVNLLPFPGLDGYQLLVLAVEGISKKKIPSKVKTIMSIIGLCLLFTFMVVLVIKDVITYIL